GDRVLEDRVEEPDVVVNRLDGLLRPDRLPGLPASLLRRCRESSLPPALDECLDVAFQDAVEWAFPELGDEMNVQVRAVPLDRRELAPACFKFCDQAFAGHPYGHVLREGRRGRLAH